MSQNLRQLVIAFLLDEYTGVGYHLVINKKEFLNMEIKEIKNGKKDFLDLLLLADEQEDMVDRYLERR